MDVHKLKQQSGDYDVLDIFISSAFRVFFHQNWGFLCLDKHFQFWIQVTFSTVFCSFRNVYLEKVSEIKVSNME